MVCRMMCWCPRCTPSKKPMARHTFRPRASSSLAARMIFIALAPLPAWDYALFEFFVRKCEHFFKLDRIGHVELAGGRAPQGGQMGAATKFLAKVVRQAADICSLGAGDAEPANRFAVIKKPEIVDVDQPLLTRHFNAFARKFV